MMFTNRFHTNMTASANCAEASFPCTDSASNMNIVALLDAVIAASIIIIAIIVVSLISTILVVGLLLAILVLVLVGLLIMEKVNRRRRRVTA
ncbi:hypothetical protein [Oscillibacter sp.]|uniref:hypothetical protein n=2 Tax=Oscillibacter TaxID=459786 RepID=UPI0028A2DA27|nr:hypothetical protein [Oscillibacter sp.]